MRNMRDDDPFIERIATPLRASEQVRPDFDVRVMSNLRGAVGGLSRRSSGSWWRRTRVYRTTPLRQLATAAAAALVMVGVAWGAARMAGERGGDAPAVAVAAAPDTVHMVRFVLVDSSAMRVSLVGSFNHWRRDVTSFQPTGVPGVWAVQVPLTAGRHEYAFVVSNADGERWIADPLAPRRHDDFGTESSVIWIRPRSS